VVLELGLPRRTADLRDITQRIGEWIVPELVDVDLELWQ
jgi:hypothetical protein